MRKFFGLIVIVLLIAIGLQAIKPDDEDSIHSRLMPTIIEMQAEHSPVRPVRPDQLDLEDIHTGDILFKVNKNYEHKILVVKSPYMVDGDCKYDYVIWENGAPFGKFIRSGYCSDAGLVEYTGTFYGWNSSNYLKRTDENSLTPEQIEEAIKDMRPFPVPDPEPILDEKNL